MKKKKNLKKYFDAEKELITSDGLYRLLYDFVYSYGNKIYSETEWILGDNNNLVRDSECWTLKNLNRYKYLEFTTKEYNEPLKKKFGNLFYDDIIAKIEFFIDRKTGNQIATFSYDTFIYSLMAYNKALINFSIEDIKEILHISNREEKNRKFLDKLYSKKKEINDVIKYRKKSVYYTKIINVYNEDNLEKIFGSFESYLNISLSSIDKIQKEFKDILDFFNKPIDLKKVMDCFDYDKFCLAIALGSIEKIHIVEDTYNMLFYSIKYLNAYLHAVKKVREEIPTYNARITIFDSKNKKNIQIDIDDIIKEYDKIISMHPEYTMFELSLDTVNKIKLDQRFKKVNLDTFEGQKKLLEFLVNIGKSQELVASWKLIPNSKLTTIYIQKKEIDSEKNDTSEVEEIEKVINTNVKSGTDLTRIEYILNCKKYLDNSNYIYKIYGIESFSGYVGYIYPNGKVILEKYYESDKTKRISNGNATYVITLESFLINSKLSKSQLIKKISSGSKEIQRIFHKIDDLDKWISEINKAMSGNEYTDDVINYIDTLIECSKINKKNKII